MIRLTLHNIKIIKDASIEFSGLTVIAGKNDTGKTTIGKYLYKTITFKMGEKQNDIITGFINYHSEVAHSEVTSRNTTIEESKKREN
ncbi:ATP-binding protein, partial [Candidatus Venteria ishoeyi]|uniref:ATP-binding protein n=1 Tax=Candidatus Venteria ishoeyi TaxID=1899563 RepID=UPI0025A5BD87